MLDLSLAVLTVGAASDVLLSKQQNMDTLTFVHLVHLAAQVVHFPPERGVRVIAEPGRFFAEAAASLIVPVYGVRDRTCAKTGAPKKDYWITGGAPCRCSSDAAIRMLSTLCLCFICPCLDCIDLLGLPHADGRQSSSTPYCRCLQQ